MAVRSASLPAAHTAPLPRPPRSPPPRPTARAPARARPGRTPPRTDPPDIRKAGGSATGLSIRGVRFVAPGRGDPCEMGPGRLLPALLRDVGRGTRRADLRLLGALVAEGRAVFREVV